MTSEQKEAFLNSWFGSLPECSGHWTHGMSGNIVDEVNARFDEAMQAYTRAVPDVPELVRWKHCEYPNQHKIMEHKDECYVLYNQAAAMLAAKDDEIERLKDENRSIFDTYLDRHNKIVTLENELAQIKAQEPVDQTPEIERLREALEFYADGINNRIARSALSGEEPS